MNKKVKINTRLKNLSNNSYPCFPHIRVNLKGYESSSIKIIEKVTKVMRIHKVSEDFIKSYQNDSRKSKSGDLLIIAKKWVDVNY